jgi:FkbM family methyltransferase
VSTPSIGLGNFLFRRCYPLYLPLYRLYKAWSDRSERSLLGEIIKPGMVVVDVGANIGIYTNFLADLVGPGGTVFAFEPSRLNFSRLRSNVRSDNVTMIEAAVGETSGTAQLFLSHEANVDHRLYDSGDGRSAVDVSLVSLDDYFPAGSRVDFIKVDVQGHEYSVLKGAERIFKDNPHLVCVLEFWPFGLAKAGVAPKDLMSLIADLGFAHEVIGSRSAMITHPDSGSFPESEYCNLIIKRPTSSRHRE